jgi:hypothetical protein
MAVVGERYGGLDQIDVAVHRFGRVAVDPPGRAFGWPAKEILAGKPPPLYRAT